MYVDVWNDLSAVFTNIQNNLVSFFCDPYLFGDECNAVHELTDERSISGMHICKRGDVFFWNHKDVRRRLWMNIFKCQKILVLESFFCWNLIVDDFAKKTIGHIYFRFISDAFEHPKQFFRRQRLLV